MQRFRKLAFGALLLTGFALAMPAAAEAAWGGSGPRGGAFSGRSFGPGPRGFAGPRFNGPGFNGPRFGAGWSRGTWTHGWHDNRFGWWWTVGPSWYWYSQPVYPYPAYPAYYDYGPLDDGPTVRGYYPPPRAQRGPAPQQYWYYCDNPRGYYPYVGDCAEWRQVAATPPGADEPPPSDDQPNYDDQPPPDDYGAPDDGPPDDGPRQLQPR